MELTRASLRRSSFSLAAYARLDICGRGEPPMAFMPENRFGAGAKRGLCRSQSQAGLAIQPLFGLGFRLRWSGSAVEGLPVFGYGLAARARVLTVLARVLTVLARVLTVLARVLTVFVCVLSAWVRGFKGIGADWGVWEAQLLRFSPLPIDRQPYTFKLKGL